MKVSSQVRRLGLLWVTAVSIAAATVVAAAPPVGGATAFGGVLGWRFQPARHGTVPAGTATYSDATCPTDRFCALAGAGAGRGVVTLTYDGGATWRSVVVPGSGGLDAIACPTATVCYAGGASGSGSSSRPEIFVSHDSGSSWTEQSVPSTALIGSIACPTAESCLAVGYQSAPFRAAVISTRDGGSSWTELRPPASVLTTIRCVDISHCWVAGVGVYFTSDLGKSWRSEAPPQPGSGGPQGGIGPAAYSETIDVEFQNRSDGWVVGGDQCGGLGVTECPGVAYHTTDGGHSWILSVASQQLPFGWQINCVGPACLMVTQGFSFSRIVATSDDGATWNTNQVVPGAINALACTPDRGFCLLAGGTSSGAELLTYGAARRAPTAASRPLTVSTISSALISPGRAFASPVADLLAALVTVAVVVLITFPSQLFNYTFQENYEEIRDGWERRLKLLRRLRLRVMGEEGHSRDLAVFAGVLLVGSVLDGFLDPSFGLSAASGITLLSMVLAIVISVAVPGLVAYAYRKLRRRSTELRLRALPLGLLVALVCVLISRLVDFQPGYLYGLVVGVAYSKRMAVHEEGHVAALSAISSLVVASLAWIAWIPVHGLATGPSPAPGPVLLSDLLGAIFVGGLVGNVVGLLPLQFLQGGTVARWHKGMWAGVYGLAGFGFIQALLQPATAVSRHGSAPLITALVLFVAFGAASVAFYLYFQRRQRHPAEEGAHRSAAGTGLWRHFLLGIGLERSEPAGAPAGPDG